MLISGNKGPLALSPATSHTKVVGDGSPLFEKCRGCSPPIGVCGLAPVVQ